MIGTAVGHYRVLARLSSGGMGIVYRAEHELLGKPVAIKVLHPELSTNRAIVDRFFIEAKATTSIRHVGIVEVFDFGYLDSGHAYLVMELLDGEPLSSTLRRGRLSSLAAIALMRGVASALTAAHAKGIVHRDLKPDNIFLVPDPDSPLGVRPKLLDFGIAKLTDIGLASSATQTGTVMGTPTYMSPEQCKGTGEVDHRADLYSLGCVLYELVAGRPPFISHGAGELIGSHLYVQPESPRAHAPELAPELEQLILGLLAKSPAERPSSATELVQRLDELARGLGGGGPAMSAAAQELARGTGRSLPIPAGGTPVGLPVGTPGSSSGAEGPMGSGIGRGGTPVGRADRGAGVSGVSGPEAQTMATPYSLQQLGLQGAPGVHGVHGLQATPSTPWPQAAGAVGLHGTPGMYGLSPAGYGLAPASPTTLGGAAGPAARAASRRWLAMVGGALLIVGGVITAVALSGGEDGAVTSGGAAAAGSAALPASGAAAASASEQSATPNASAVAAGVDARVEAATAVDAGVEAASTATADAGATPSGAADAGAGVAGQVAAPRGKQAAGLDARPDARPKVKGTARPRSDVPSLIEDDI